MEIAVGIVVLLLLTVVVITLVVVTRVGDVKFETIESSPPRKLVRRVVGEKDFGGTWTCDIASSPGGST